MQNMKLNVLVFKPKSIVTIYVHTFCSYLDHFFDQVFFNWCVFLRVACLFLSKAVNVIILYGNTQQVVLCEPSSMEVVREFLESSTIHGLSYIQTAKVRKKRCLLGKHPLSKTDEFSEKFRRGGGGHFRSKNLYCKIWTFEQGYFGMKIIKNGLFRVCFSTNFHVELLYYMHLMGNMII